uniref:Uncharacterized protein n=1 Tax=Octopus bimaculoides TaxID=37653 RepID=A0A0L8FVW2_OCTBM
MMPTQSQGLINYKQPSHMLCHFYPRPKNNLVSDNQTHRISLYWFLRFTEDFGNSVHICLVLLMVLPIFKDLWIGPLINTIQTSVSQTFFLTITSFFNSHFFQDPHPTFLMLVHGILAQNNLVPGTHLMWLTIYLKHTNISFNNPIL